MAKSDRIARAVHHSSHLLITLVVVAGLAGCSSDEAPASSVTTTSRSSTTTTTTGSTTTTTASTDTTAISTTPPTQPGRQSVEDQIVARYIGYWDARFAANTGTPNPDDPALREYATGAQLDAVISETRSNLDDGLALREADKPADLQRVRVVEVEGNRAVVQECVVDDAVVVRRDGGEVVNDAVATHNVRGELLKVDGRWRVSKAQLIQRWEGVAGCAPKG